MAGDAARNGTNFTSPRRVAWGRTIRWLVVLGGLLIADCLANCAVPAAHTIEAPAPSQIVAWPSAPRDAIEPRPVAELGETAAAKPPDGKPARPFSCETSNTAEVSDRRCRADSRLSAAASAPGPRGLVADLGFGRAGPDVGETATHPAARLRSKQGLDRPDDRSAVITHAVSGVGGLHVRAWTPPRPRTPITNASDLFSPAARSAMGGPAAAPPD